ncbi:MAG: O-antigen ligase family protein [Cetobacterium sp.]
MDKILIFLGVLFSGGDHLAFRISGTTFKLSQFIFLIYTFNLVVTRKYKIFKNVSKNYIYIFIPHLLSLFYTKDFKNSFLYFIMIIFNLFIIVMPLINYCSNRKNSELLKNYIQIFRVVGILTIFQFLLASIGILIPFFQNDYYKGIFRPSLWFYEPSYLATYFCFYIGIALIDYRYNRNKKDLILSWFFTALTTSSTGFIGIVISIIYIVILERSLLKKIKTILLVFILTLIIFGLISIIKFDIIKIFIGRLFTEGISNSSGVRSIGFFQAYQIFKSYPILGIGANAYKEYHYTKAPVTNVTLEILTNLGVVGFILFLMFFIYLFKQYKKNKKDFEIKAMWISLILFGVILQANQNYMRLYMWIHIALFIGMTKNIENGVKNASINNNS